MLIIDCDCHPSVQQIAWSIRGECGERRLIHSGGEAEQFYRELKKKGISVRGGRLPGTRVGSSACRRSSTLGYAGSVGVCRGI